MSYMKRLAQALFSTDDVVSSSARFREQELMDSRQDVTKTPVPESGIKEHMIQNREVSILH